MITGQRITSDVYILHIRKNKTSEGKFEYILTKNNKNIAVGTADKPEELFKGFNPKIHYSENFKKLK